MKGFQREDLEFSLCGLNCGLCTMRLGGYCPGCGGGPGNQSCAIAQCGLAHEGISYCYQCGEYPCDRYKEEDLYDSFITHRNRRVDLERHRLLGPECYRAELAEKEALLGKLLETCNDGRRKSFFALAVNLLDLEALEPVRAYLEQMPDRPVKERAALVSSLLHEAAGRKGISLTLRKKPKK